MRAPVARVGIIGSSQSGKSSLFCALCSIDYARHDRPKYGIIKIKDKRLIELHGMIQEQKELVFPCIELYDTQPIYLEKDQRDQNVHVFSTLREMDGFVAVLKGYETEGSTQQKRQSILNELEQLKTELYLYDLEMIQGRIDRLKSSRKHTDEEEKELKTLQQLFEAVSSGDKSAIKNIASEDEKRLRGFQFFSKKPLLGIANLSDQDMNISLNGDFLPVSIKLELDLTQLNPDEKKEFMRSYNLEELWIDKLSLKIFDSLGFIMFFTIGRDEVAGWAVNEGCTAYEAAGKIHTDFQKGFVACDVFNYDQIQKLGSLRQAQNSSKTHGKDYIIASGDVVNFKFSP